MCSLCSLNFLWISRQISTTIATMHGPINNKQSGGRSDKSLDRDVVSKYSR